MTTAVLYMFLTAFSATLLYVILKCFARYNIYHLHALTINYLTAGLFAFFMNMNQSIQAIPVFKEIVLPCIATGLLFIIVFYITAITTDKHGLAITSIAAKMSMVIPIIAGFILYKDEITIIKVTGMLLALIAIYISDSRKDKQGKKHLMILPLLLFIGSGLVDTSVKMSQQYVINADNRQLYIASCFGFAGIFGMMVSLFHKWTEGVIVSLNSILAGIILGTVNYFSLAFLIHCLSLPGVESSIAFAVINMIVVILSGLFAFLLFREKPSKANISGIILAIAAIVILSFNEYMP